MILNSTREQWGNYDAYAAWSMWSNGEHVTHEYTPVDRVVKRRNLNTKIYVVNSFEKNTF